MFFPSTSFTPMCHSLLPVTPFPPSPKATVCRDIEPDCSRRSRAGDCDLEGSGMIGPGGSCRKTCGDCKDCKGEDEQCQRLNFLGRRTTEGA